MSIFIIEKLLAGFCINHDHSEVYSLMIIYFVNLFLKINWEVLVKHLNLISTAGIHKANDVCRLYFPSGKVSDVSAVQEFNHGRVLVFIAFKKESLRVVFCKS